MDKELHLNNEHIFLAIATTKDYHIISKKTKKKIKEGGQAHQQLIQSIQSQYSFSFDSFFHLIGEGGERRRGTDQAFCSLYNK